MGSGIFKFGPSSSTSSKATFRSNEGRLEVEGLGLGKEFDESEGTSTAFSFITSSDLPVLLLSGKSFFSSDSCFNWFALTGFRKDRIGLD